ncbi:MAG: hypothetical protein ACRD3W_29135 [Terriglobales bacterium]
MLMVVSFVLPFVAGAVLVVSIRTLPSPLLDWLMQQPADRPALVPQSLDRGVALLISAAISIVILVVTIGLFLFRRWARSAYVVITTLYFVALFFARPSVLPSPAFAVFAVGYFVQGVIIAMAFLPPTSELFVSKRSNQTLQPTAGRSDV